MTLLARAGSGNFELDGVIVLVILLLVAVYSLRSALDSFMGWRDRRKEARRKAEQDREPIEDDLDSGLQ